MYSQQDSRWKNEIIGFNTDPTATIGALGCVITDIANLLVRATGDAKFTPSFINSWGKANGAFVKTYKLINGQSVLDGSGIWIWSKTTQIAPGALTLQSQSSINLSDINSFVTPVPDFVILGVNNGGHYVLVTSVNRIFDPEDGAIKPINAYGGWKSAHYFIATTTTPIAPPIIPPVTSGPLNAVATINVPILNARAAPTTASPVMATAHAGTIHVNQWIKGERVTVNGRVDDVWLLTDGGHFITQAGTTYRE